MPQAPYTVFFYITQGKTEHMANIIDPKVLAMLQKIKIPKIELLSYYCYPLSIKYRTISIPTHRCTPQLRPRLPSQPQSRTPSRLPLAIIIVVVAVVSFLLPLWLASWSQSQSQSLVPVAVVVVVVAVVVVTTVDDAPVGTDAKTSNVSSMLMLLPPIPTLPLHLNLQQQ